MPDKNLHKIFESTPCPSLETIKKYHLGKLSDADKHALEKHFIDCKLCRDAIEGFSDVKNYGKVDEINKAVSKLVTQRGTEHNIKKWISIAAMLLFIAGSSSYLYYVTTRLDCGEMVSESGDLKEKQKEIEQRIKEESVKKEESKLQFKDKSQAEEKSILTKVKPPAPAKKAEVRISDESTISLDMSVNTAGASLISSTNVNDLAPKEESVQFTTTVHPDMSSEEVFGDLDIEIEEISVDLAQMEEEISTTESIESEPEMYDAISRIFADSSLVTESRFADVTTSSQSKKTRNRQKSFRKNKSRAKSVSKESNVLLNDAIVPMSESPETTEESNEINDPRTQGLSYYNMSLFENAIENFTVHSYANPADYEIMLKNGIAHYNLEKYSESLLLLNGIPTYEELYYEEARWYMVLSYIELDQKEKAKNALEDIIGLNGKRKTEAETKLKELN
ncbi:hypothetical protein JYU23_01620 [bacterium AH-315-C07]|nr:hypothetical protein [bacterium AH-315-C07]